MAEEQLSPRLQRGWSVPRVSLVRFPQQNINFCSGPLCAGQLPDGLVCAARL